ncbi:MAG: hypothetical protein KQH63_07920 [Desulfobulbaceae bacterium]|nr:hypothetical protein [Desulfobulbaceae bacterium]
MLEEDQVLHRMEGKLHPLKTKIDNYKEMIGFVSQLPAVIEILNKGKKWDGNINPETAFNRYTGVLTRAFEKHKDIITIYVLDINSDIQFSLRKNFTTSQYDPVDEKNIDFDALFLNTTLQMTEKDFFISPLIRSPKKNCDKTAPCLLLRIFTPILFNKEKIGIFISEIDIGILIEYFPEMQWVMNNGTYLDADHDRNTAFEKFPGLKDLFSQGNPAVWSNDQIKMAWVPFFKGKDSTLTLWAGKEVSLTSLRAVQKTVFINMIASLLVLLFFFLFTAFFISKRIQNAASLFLHDLEQAIFNQKKLTWGKRSKIRDFAEVFTKISHILEKNSILEQKRIQDQKELQNRLDEIRTLRDILPICSFCKNIRNDDGYYEQLEAYFHKHSGMDFSHTICPECMKKHYPEEYESIVSKKE